MYELMGRAHAALLQERGQGTVEYVGLMLLLARDPGGRRRGEPEGSTTSAASPKTVVDEAQGRDRRRRRARTERA